MGHTPFGFQTSLTISVCSQENSHLPIHRYCFLSLLLNMGHCVRQHERFVVPERGSMNENNLDLQSTDRKTLEMGNPMFDSLLEGWQMLEGWLGVFGCLNNAVWSLNLAPFLSYLYLESKKTSLVLCFIHSSITLAFSEQKFSGQEQLFVKLTWKELHVMKPLVHQR